MWCNSFPEGCSETSARARWCAWFSAMIAGGDALGFSFGFTIFGERRLRSAAWPPNQNRRSRPDCNKCLGSKTAVMIGGYVPAEWKRRMKSRFSGFNSAVLFCGPDRRMKPPIVRFQGQNCIFTCPVFGLYKYILISGSQTKFLIPRTLERYLERLERKTLKITSLFLSTHFHMHKSSSKHHLGSSSVC